MRGRGDLFSKRSPLPLIKKTLPQGSDGARRMLDALGLELFQEALGHFKA